MSFLLIEKIQKVFRYQSKYDQKGDYQFIIHNAKIYHD